MKYVILITGASSGFGALTARSQRDSFTNLCLESFLLYTNRVVSYWQTGDTVLTRQVSRRVTFQSSAFVENCDLGSGNNSPTRVGDGTQNARDLALRPRVRGEHKQQ